MNDLVFELQHFPYKLRSVVEDLTDHQLNASYREGGWNIRQIVNHISDSHLNGFARHKFALTEDSPTIKPYNQDAWAALADSNQEIESALMLIEAVHTRWAQLLNSLTEEQWRRVYVHPEYAKTPTLEQSLHDYVVHGIGHLKQIEIAMQSPVWTK